MKYYIVYEPVSGEITSFGTCADGDLLIQGDNVIEGEGSFATHYISNGAVVAYTPEQASAKQARVPFCQWSNTTMSWVDNRPLPLIKLSKWEQVKQWRAAAIDANMTTPYGVIQCRPEDRQNITDAIMLLQNLPANTTIDWTMYDNSVVSLNLTQMTQIGLLLGQKTQIAHYTARSLRTYIDGCTTNAEVEETTWPG